MAHIYKYIYWFFFTVIQFVVDPLNALVTKCSLENVTMSASLHMLNIEISFFFNIWNSGKISKAFGNFFFSVYILN